MFPFDQNFTGWVLSGNDSESLWTDPKFRDPVSRLYILEEDSPEWGLGIKQIDVSKIGIQV